MDNRGKRCSQHGYGLQGHSHVAGKATSASGLMLAGGDRLAD